MKFLTELILNHVYISATVLFVVLLSLRVPDWLWYIKFLSNPYSRFKKSYTRPTAGTSQLKYRITDKSDSLLAFSRTYDTPSLKNLSFDINKKVQFMGAFKYLVNYVISVGLPLFALILATSDFIIDFLTLEQKASLLDMISFVLVFSVIVALVDFIIDLMLKSSLNHFLQAIEETLKSR